MPSQSRSNLVPAAVPQLDLGRLAEFSRLKAQIPKARQKYYKVHRQVLTCANLYFDEFERERDHVIFLRREIRMASRGVATDIALDSITAAGQISNGTEQLYNAEQHLLDRVWRFLRSHVHPDRSKENSERFMAAKAAYEFRDLTFLHEMFLTIKHAHDLYWRQSDGIAYCMQELERPVVSLRILQTTPEFKIAAAHARGNCDSARSSARARLIELAIVLQAELNHIIGVPNHGNGSKEASEGRSTGEEEGQAGTEGRDGQEVHGAEVHGGQEGAGRRTD